MKASGFVAEAIARAGQEATVAPAARCTCRSSPLVPAKRGSQNVL